MAQKPPCRWLLILIDNCCFSQPPYSHLKSTLIPPQNPFDVCYNESFSGMHFGPGVSTSIVLVGGYNVLFVSEWDDEWDTAGLKALMIVQRNGAFVVWKLLDGVSTVWSKSSSRLFVCWPSVLYNALEVYGKLSVLSFRWSDKAVGFLGIYVASGRFVLLDHTVRQAYYYTNITEKQYAASFWAERHEIQPNHQ
jgi:hypothetical protein